jgi:hypothetical protein
MSVPSRSNMHPAQEPAVQCYEALQQGVAKQASHVPLDHQHAAVVSTLALQIHDFGPHMMAQGLASRHDICTPLQMQGLQAASTTSLHATAAVAAAVQPESTSKWSVGHSCESEGGRARWVHVRNAVEKKAHSGGFGCGATHDRVESAAEEHHGHGQPTGLSAEAGTTVGPSSRSTWLQIVRAARLDPVVAAQKAFQAAWATVRIYPCVHMPGGQPAALLLVGPSSVILPQFFSSQTIDVW